MVMISLKIVSSHKNVFHHVSLQSISLCKFKSFAACSDTKKICVCFVTYFRERVYTMDDSLHACNMFTLIHVFTTAPLRGSRLARIAGK